MKKNLLARLTFLVFLAFSAFSQEIQNVPDLLKGVWKNNGRYVLFDTGYVSQNGSVIPQYILRTFYQWYPDRAAESQQYSQKNKRPENNTTQRDKAEEIQIRFVPLTDELFPESQGKPVVQNDGDILNAESIPSGAWNLEIKYPHNRETYNVPVAVIGDKLYLNFIVKKEDSDQVPYSDLLAGTVMRSKNPLSGFWMDWGNASGILICPPVSSSELISYFITDNAVYHIRYWRTDMEYDGEKQAVFSDGDETFQVPKHLLVAGKTYTCVTGRRTRIRNIEKSKTLPEEYNLNSVLVKKHVARGDGSSSEYTVQTATICALGEPYLSIVPDKTIEEIFSEDLARQRPKPEPLFPPHGVLDFDWSIIEDPPKSYNRRMLDLGK